ncbi:hypothetical protein [Alicyclobacillus acidoterrestris]|uniref:Uncharacterized protein n=1 Tax=Alicyclobacillus acidoterrestris (strain ATCC 49025 / DSM 3922 / CIP 106132 / NCIMB 13137 / GD3B) TaxID=1356854 RepID=T0CZC5_ALIAG|nr:hypothetical protein [Alicyclobacillus acidoterrestris]EPZ44642.1 hypothetical protein N007_10410 [Alicyclobacillus acidoterrestris ATCC 49025]UNO50343.1 hypothetical protein K1I37_07675 [Alicyclobacillus acidoterrestris]
MTNRDDKDLQNIMQQLSEVPFRDELKSRVLNAAKAEDLALAGGRRKRVPRSWYAGIASGLVAAVAVIGVGIGLERHDAEQAANQASATSAPVSFQLDAKQYGMAQAPLQISNVRVGTLPGDPKDSDVLADLTNTSDKPVRESDIFGVLSFTPAGNNNLQTGENWLTFVNGPSGSIAPHQTAQWGFHPDGSTLHAPLTQAIVETPHLSFYLAHLVPTDMADKVWTKSPLDVSQVQVEPRVVDGRAQSVQIDARLTNTSKSPFPLSSARAVIWFASSPEQSFMSDGSIRFMYHLTPEYKDQVWPSVVQPGQSIAVNFRVISDNQSDFFNRMAHVMIINTPQGGF